MPEQATTNDDQDPEVTQLIEQLLNKMPDGAANRSLLDKLLRQVVALPGKSLDRLELKILNSAIQDFVNAFETFAPYRDRKKVSIFGSARTPKDTPLYNHARKFAATLVKHGFMAITGAGPGIMAAGNEGATREHSFGVNIELPFEQHSNPHIRGDSKLINFKYFFTRKLSFVKESAAVVLFPGGMGTQDEGFETLTLIQTGKSNPIPILLMDYPGGDYWIDWEQFVREVLLRRGLISKDDLNLFRYTTDIDKAIDHIKLFYRNYHSLRYVRDEVIIRLRHRPTDELIEQLNEQYSELLADGRFERMDQPHEWESRESDEVKAMYRIRFHFIRRRLGTLRRMIDTLNLAVESD